MTRLLISGLTFGAIAVVVGYALHSLSTAVAPPFAEDRARIEILMDRAASVRSIALGNSHCNAIDFDALGIDGHHVWQAGNDAFEAEWQMRTLLPRLPALDSVLMTVSYTSFGRDNSLSTGRDRTENRRISYALLPGLLPVPGDFGNLIKGKLSSLVRQDHWEGVFAAFGGGEAEEIPPINRHGFVLRRPDDDHMEPGEIKRAARTFTVPKHLRIQRQMLEADPQLPQRAFSAFRGMVERARAAGVRLVLYTPPYHRSYSEAFDAREIRRMRRLVDRLVRETGVEYHDFSTDPDFVDRYEWFFDPDHLNRDGAREFCARRLRPLFAN